MNTLILCRFRQGLPLVQRVGILTTRFLIYQAGHSRILNLVKMNDSCDSEITCKNSIRNIGYLEVPVNSG